MAFRDFLPSADHLKPDMERTVRLAVTGLTRAGKTVFISSLIRNLLSADQHPANLPLLKVVRDGRFVTARLDHNAAVHAPLFPYEDCMRALCATAPAWPQPTTDISQIRIKIAFKPAPDTLTGRAGGLWLIGRAVPKHLILNVDVIDYPGEWLLDLPLETKTFAQWSDDMLALCAHQPRAALAREWLAYVGSRDERGPADEEFLANAARLYTAFLETCRAEPHCLKLLQPGHFLRPGQYRGSPLLRFCPLPAKSKRAAPRGSRPATCAASGAPRAWRRRTQKQA